MATKAPAETVTARNARYEAGLAKAFRKSRSSAAVALRRALTAGISAAIAGRQKKRDITPYLEKGFAAARDAVGRPGPKQ